MSGTDKRHAARASNRPLRQWTWGTLPTYNGFTHFERVRGWQTIWWMIDTGRLKKPDTCSISGQRGPVGMHSENYYAWSPYGIDHRLHKILHQRFRKPDDWLRIVDRYAVTGDEWFAKLSLKPIDLASALRQQSGAAIADIFAAAGITHPD